MRYFSCLLPKVKLQEKCILNYVYLLEYIWDFLKLDEPYF